MEKEWAVYGAAPSLLDALCALTGECDNIGDMVDEHGDTWKSTLFAEKIARAKAIILTCNITKK